MPPLSQIVELMRPRQWLKNLAVFAACIFAGRLVDPESVVRTMVAFGCLCMVSSGLYAFNDAMDAERDRMHPVKRNRPVARGAITARFSAGLATALTLGGIAGSAALGYPFLVAVATYASVQILYTSWFKNVAIVDVLVIASGFVIRAVAGAWVIDVPVSPWLVLCTGLLALFLATAKRRHELTSLSEGSALHRPVLASYSAELLDSFMVTLSSATITSYALYTFFEERAPDYLMMLTIPLVVYGVLRYQMLVLNEGGGGRPEDVLLGDRSILVTVGLWVLAVCVLLYVI